MQQLEHVVEHRLGLAYGETTHRDSGPGTLLQCALQGAQAQLLVSAALDDRPERLTYRVPQLFVLCLTTAEPAERPLHALRGRLRSGLAGHDMIEGHGHVG